MSGKGQDIKDIEVIGHTRSAFLVRGALATGSLYGAGAVGGFVTRAFACGLRRTAVWSIPGSWTSAV